MRIEQLGGNPMIADLLKSAGLRPTRQRIAIAQRLFCGTGGHTTADRLYAELCRANQRVVLATVYNTLQALVTAGLLRQIRVKGLTFYDSNQADHYHFLVSRECRLIDVPSADLAVEMPAIPEGYELNRVDVLIHLVRKESC